MLRVSPGVGRQAFPLGDVLSLGRTVEENLSGCTVLREAAQGFGQPHGSQ